MLSQLNQSLLCLGLPQKLGPGRTRQIFVYFAKKFVITSVIQVRPVIFSHQILSSITKLQRHRRSAWEQDKFLSGVKTVQILQFARHDLKKKFLSAPTIPKLKIWQSQILSRFLDGPNKFCQSSASGPSPNRNYLSIFVLSTFNYQRAKLMA